MGIKTKWWEIYPHSDILLQANTQKQLLLSQFNSLFKERSFPFTHKKSYLNATRYTRSTLISPHHLHQTLYIILPLSNMKQLKPSDATFWCKTKSLNRSSREPCNDTDSMFVKAPLRFLVSRQWLFPCVRHQKNLPSECPLTTIIRCRASIWADQTEPITIFVISRSRSGFHTRIHCRWRMTRWPIVRRNLERIRWIEV